MLDYTAFVARLEGVQHHGDCKCSARCPSHDDNRASLSVSRGRDGRIVLHCHAGCTPEAVLKSMGLTWPDVLPERERAAGPQIEERYPYRDETGDLLFEVVRLFPKDFRQRRPARPGDDPAKVKADADGRSWVWSTSGVRRVLYRLTEVVEAVRAGRTIYLAEGERDVHTLAELGLDATTSPGGAGKWRPEFADTLKDAIRVVVLPDGDPAPHPGQKHCRDVVRSLLALPDPPEVRVVEVPGCKDVSDWIKSGGTVERLHELVNEAPSGRNWLTTWEPRLDVQVVTKGPKKRSQKATAEPATGPTSRATPDELFEQCRDLALSPDILGEVGRVLEASGLVGEKENAALLYLAGTSRVFTRPINVLIKSESSSGKTFLTETVFGSSTRPGLFPPEAYSRRDGASARAFVYSREDFRHRTLFLNETDSFATVTRKDTDTTGTALLRGLLDNNEIRYEVTVRDPETGEFGTQLVLKEGPTGAVLTGCHAIDTEVENRCLVLTLDDGASQTARIKLEAARAAEGRGPRPPDPRPFHALQRWLAAVGPWEVVIPFATRIVGTGTACRWRRDFRTVLNLIRAHALLHRATRPVDVEGRIVAALDDYRAVWSLADAALSAIDDGLTEGVRAAVDAVDRLKAEGRPVTYKTVGALLKVSRAGVQRRLDDAVKAGFLTRDDAPRNKAATFSLGDPLPTAKSVLPDPEEVESESGVYLPAGTAGTGLFSAPGLEESGAQAVWAPVGSETRQVEDDAHVEVQEVRVGQGDEAFFKELDQALSEDLNHATR